MSSALRLALALIAALVVAAGCGGDSQADADYVDSINKVQADFADSVRESSSGSTGSDPVERAERTFSSLDTAIKELVADLRDIEPPDEVATLHERLITQMRQFNDEIQQAGDALGSGDPQRVLAAQSGFATSASRLGTQISATITDINAKLQE